MAPRTYYLPLDGVRGVAVLAVMLLHFTVFVPVGVTERFVSGWIATGWIGVDLFFVLSGFLITGILMDTRDDPHHFRNFYARRTLRIFPLYYAYLALLFILLPMLHEGAALEHAVDDRRFWLWTYLGNILMARGWDAMPSHTTHLWSLAVEEQFYLVWPLLVFAVQRKWLTALCIATFVGAILTRAYLATQGAAAAAYVLTPARMDTLAAGSLVAVVLRQRGPEAVRLLGTSMLWPGAFLIGLGVVWNLTHGSTQVLAALDFGTEEFAYPGIALVFAALVAHIVTSPPTAPVPKLFTNRTLRTLGKYSYGLYLIHVPIRNIARLLIERRGGLPSLWGSEIPAQVLVTVVGIAVSFVLAYASWHLFEKQVLKLKSRFDSKVAQTPEPTPDAAPIPAPMGQIAPQG